MKSFKNTLQTIWRWMKARSIRMAEYDKRRGIWFLIVCWLATMAVAVALALGNPTGASVFAHIIDIAIVITLNNLLFFVATSLLAGLFSFIYLPLPRLYLGGFAYLTTLSVLSLNSNKSTIAFLLIGGIGYSLAVVAIGFLLIMIVRKNKVAIIVTALIVVVGAGSAIYSSMKDVDMSDSQQVAVDNSDDHSVQNPGDKGDFDYTFFTYGSGQDVQRKEFGEQVDEVTETVDASEDVTNWKEKREKFWEFSPSELPINGRTFLPEGEGPFPVILLVHGNHTMEYFSTDGYDYLGEQLASRGFLTISVDEDFLNYSNVSGIPNDDYKLRAWIVLQHLLQLKELNQSPESKFYEKIDLDDVALVGHSRGGQAVLMATDYATFFDDKTLLNEMESIHIKAVTTLAPTDKKIDRKSPDLHNVSYLTLQGARDADIDEFRGDRQFYRTTFDGTEEGFKTSLYIEEANHTQFNSSWGSRDISLPQGLFLNQRDTMRASDQRQIAKVYLSAFFESVFNGESIYNHLFENPLYGKDWLPDTRLINKYRDAAYQPIVQFREGDMEMVERQGFKKFGVTTPVERGGKNHLRDSLSLEWEKDAELTFDLSREKLEKIDHSHENGLVLTMANIDDETDERVPDIDVEIKTSDGTAVQVPLEEFMPFPPVITTDYTPFGWLDGIYRDGKYEQSWEPIFQTFELPFGTFEQYDPDFVKENMTQLTLHFKSHPGKILIEELGVR